MSRVVQVAGRGWDCNMFVVKDEKSNGYDLVDSGHGVAFDETWTEISAIIDPRLIRRVVVTHEHLDHVNGLPRWRDAGAKIVTSAACADKLLAGHDPTSAMFGGSIPKLEVDQILHDGDDIQIGDRAHKALRTPGHSPGSMCYWDESDGMLFAGDVLFANGGIGRFDFPDSDLAAHAESILRLGELPVRVLHSGHGPSSEGDEAARSVKGSMAHVTACLHESN